MSDQTDSPSTPALHKRRVRYSGKYPRKFEEKYKEHDPKRYSETVEKVMASGKTPAGTHRPIMPGEILEALDPKPGETAVDCTLGFGGHAEKILGRILPGGRLIGLDADPIELPRTEARLRGLGYGPDVLTAHRSNFAGLPQILAGMQLQGVDVVLADLGLSSMQIDDPKRGFSVKHEGPLDMRINPSRGQPASAFLAKATPAELERILAEYSDEPRARLLAPCLAGKTFFTTLELTTAVRSALPRLNLDDVELTIRRVFQAVRIAVNDEFSALETFLRNLPGCLKPDGRVGILTFHSGEDRRVKKFFESGLSDGVFENISREVIRPGPEERRANPRSTPAKLRWAIRSSSK